MTIPYQPPWMDIAFSELGVEEIRGRDSHPRIEEYHDSIADDGTPDDIAWCSSVMNFVMEQAGYTGTGSRAARSWVTWGIGLKTPAYGCVVVLWRDSPTSWKGHVGIFLGFIGDDVLLWGGNQRNEVSIRRYPKSRILAKRWPS